MTDAPSIKFTGQGSRREAAQLGKTIGVGASSALAGYAQSIHIDKLRLQLPTGASAADIDRAVRLAIERMGKGARR